MILYIFTGEEQVLRKWQWEVDVLSMLNREAKQMRCEVPSIKAKYKRRKENDRVRDSRQ